MDRKTSGRMHLVIATPGIGAVVQQRYMQSICVVLQSCQASGIAHSLELITHDPILARACNTLVAKFMDRPSATHLLFASSDIGFTPEALQRLILADKDIAAGVYPKAEVVWNDAALSRVNRGEDVATAALRYSASPTGPEGNPTELDGEFAQTEFADTGFMLIRRQVFEKLFLAYPTLRYRNVQGGGPAQNSPHQYALFDPFIERKTDVYYSGADAFCRRWRQIGGEIWIDTASQIYHIGPYEFFASPQPRYEEPAGQTAQ